MTTVYPGKQQEERENRQSNAVIRISLFIYIAFRDSVSNLNISLNYNLLFSFLAFFFFPKEKNDQAEFKPVKHQRWQATQWQDTNNLNILKLKRLPWVSLNLLFYRAGKPDLRIMFALQNHVLHAVDLCVQWKKQNCINMLPLPPFSCLSEFNISPFQPPDIYT